MPHPQALLLDQFYYIYNHAIADLTLFRRRDDYHRFLRLYAKHIEPVADTYAFNLLPDHFHLLIRTKAPHEQALPGYITSPREPSQHFSNLFNAYAKYYNRRYQHKGPLFLRPFRRKEIDNVHYNKLLMVYIHQNAQRHGLVMNFNEWPYTSYHLFLSEKPSRLKRSEAMSWFSNEADFIARHEASIDFRDISDFTFDD